MLLIMEYHGVIAAKLLSQEIRGKLMAPIFLDDLTSDGEQSKLYAIRNVAISMHILYLWVLNLMGLNFASFVLCPQPQKLILKK